MNKRKNKFSSISFTLNYLLKRKHMFKNRNIKLTHRVYKFKIGNSGFFSLKNQRFELVYLRGFKKILRRKYIRAKLTFKLRKFWFFLRPNCILSSKSVNSRMGAGVGSLVRVAINLRAYVTFLEFLNYSHYFLNKLHNLLKYKYPIKYLLKKKIV